jgi:hypothetical protein
MQARLTVLGAVLLLSGCGGSGSSTTTSTGPPPPPGPPPPATVTSGDVKASLVAPTRHPKVNANWHYRVRVTDKKGHPLGGKITVQIVDPLGQAHAVDYDDTKKPVTKMHFNGTFQDDVQYPADARGYTLTFRVIAKTPKGTVTITYPVTPS